MGVAIEMPSRTHAPWPAQVAYYGAIKNLPPEIVALIEAEPRPLPSDSDKVRACKKLYSDMQAEGLGCIDMRLPGGCLPDPARPDI